jgi:hypothetical protein
MSNAMLVDGREHAHAHRKSHEFALVRLQSHSLKSHKLLDCEWVGAVTIWALNPLCSRMARVVEQEDHFVAS